MLSNTATWLVILTLAPVVSTVVAGAVVAINHAVNASNTG